MAVAELRATLGHLLNVSMPFSKTNRVWALICNATELTENFEPDTDDVQYVCETTKTKILKAYNISMEVEMNYQKDNKIQEYYNLMLRLMPTGSQTQAEYIRFNKNETMFGTSDQFIGVRRDASVYLNNIGGSGEDVLKNQMTINGIGSGEVGYVTVTNTGSVVTYTWTAAPTIVPYVSTIGGVDMNGYYPGVGVMPTIGQSLVITGNGGVVGATITAIFENPNSITGNTTTVRADGSWEMSVSGLTINNTYNFALKQTASGVDSVTTHLFKVKLLPSNPSVTSIGGVSVSSNMEAPLDSSNKLVIVGTGTNDATVTAMFDPSTGITANTAVVTNGAWTMSVNGPTATTDYDLTFKQTISGIDSIPDGKIKLKVLAHS